MMCKQKNIFSCRPMPTGIHVSAGRFIMPMDDRPTSNRSI